MITTFLLFQTLRTGIPAIDDPGSSAIGLTVSFAPITRTTSVLEKSSLISSISRTTTRSVLALECWTHHRMAHLLRPRERCTKVSAWKQKRSGGLTCPGIRPATGWIPNRQLIPFALSDWTISEMAYCALATAIPDISQDESIGLTITWYDDDGFSIAKHFDHFVNVGASHRHPLC
jgi:hypothetical protein